ARRIGEDQSGHTGHEQQQRDQREERVVGDAGCEQEPVDGAEPIEDADPRRDPRQAEDRGGGRDDALPQARRGRRRLLASGGRQSRISSKSPGWRSLARTRRGPATSARTSPRRTNRRPPSLMDW